MARTWLSIRVELIEGHGEVFWPRPGRVFAAGRGHTFGQLAIAIDDAFARWDRAHLHQFQLSDGSVIGPQPWIEEDGGEDEAKMELSRLEPGTQFAYEFDFGDGWAHLCTVEPERIDPLETLGIVSDRPLPYWGGGVIPDQYGRRWLDDDGEMPVPPDPGLAELPPLLHGWGSQRR